MRSLWFDVLGESLLDALEHSYMIRNPIKSESDRYVLTQELPGVKEKDLNLTFEKGWLRVASPRGDPYNLFIASDVDDEKITAHLEDGILTVIFPKKSSSAVKTIKISKR